jgi:hypothetical protein
MKCTTNHEDWTEMLATCMEKRTLHELKKTQLESAPNANGLLGVVVCGPLQGNIFSILSSISSFDLG